MTHLASAEYKPQDHAPGCSKPPPESSYGLAGGGIGAYTFCPECGTVLDKIQDHEAGED